MNDTGRKLQELGEVLFVVVIILSVIFGVIYIAALPTTGFVIAGLIIIGAGILTAFVYRYLMRGFGELLENQAEQTALLMKMTEYIKQNALQAKPAPETADKPTGEVLNSPESFGTITNPTARFESRSTTEITCPVCQKIQLSNRDTCYSCGCKFFYSDEQPD
jgi:hypothetical protein